MDEKLVEQVSSSSGIPQMLVSRSAQARAEASGVAVDDVLNSWTGGEAIQATPSTETVSEPEVEIEDTSIAQSEPANEPVEVLESENIAEPIQTSVLIKEELPPPVSISEKLLRSLKFGLGFGVIAGFVQGLLSSSYLYDGLILEAETQKLIAEYNAVSFVIIISLVSFFKQSKIFGSVILFMCGHKLQGLINSTLGFSMATLSLIEHSVTIITFPG